MQHTSYVTSIKKIDNKKSVVTIDEELHFPVYRSELRQYQLEEEKPFTEEQRHQIFEELLPARVKQRVFYMLESSGKSESEIRKKLLEAYYPADIVENVIGYMKNLGYIDDERYARQYIYSRLNGKSLARIQQELQFHGISREIIRQCFGELEEEQDVADYQRFLIQKEFRKKKYDFHTDNAEQKNKIISSLLRKGFHMEDILKVMEEESRRMDSGY